MERVYTQTLQTALGPYLVIGETPDPPHEGPTPPYEGPGECGRFMPTRSLGNAVSAVLWTPLFTESHNLLEYFDGRCLWAQE